MFQDDITQVPVVSQLRSRLAFMLLKLAHSCLFGGNSQRMDSGSLVLGEWTVMRKLVNSC